MMKAFLTLRQHKAIMDFNCIYSISDFIIDGSFILFLLLCITYNDSTWMLQLIAS